MKKLVFLYGLLASLLLGCTQPDKPTVGLYVAIKRGDLDQVERHVHWGTDINQIDIEGQTPLHESARIGKIVIARLLLKNGAQVNQLNNFDQTPLDLAIFNGRIQLSELLITKFNADFDATESLFDVVHANNHDRDVFRFLARQGAKINSFDSNGLTPLIIAVKNQQRLTAKQLIANGADVNLADKQGQTPLALAMALNNTDLITLLKSNGARE